MKRIWGNACQRVCGWHALHHDDGELGCGGGDTNGRGATCIDGSGSGRAVTGSISLSGIAAGGAPVSLLGMAAGGAPITLLDAGVLEVWREV
jgi:hypothetical protein